MNFRFPPGCLHPRNFAYPCCSLMLLYSGELGSKTINWDNSALSGTSSRVCILPPGWSIAESRSSSLLLAAQLPIHPDCHEVTTLGGVVAFRLQKRLTLLESVQQQPWIDTALRSTLATGSMVTIYLTSSILGVHNSLTNADRPSELLSPETN